MRTRKIALWRYDFRERMRHGRGAAPAFLSSDIFSLSFAAVMPTDSLVSLAAL